MLPNNSDVWNNLFNFYNALSLIGSAVGIAGWMRKGSEEEDKMVSEAADLVLDNLSNADSVRLIDAMSGRDLRDQLTIEEVEEIHRERELRKFGWGRN